MKVRPHPEFNDEFLQILTSVITPFRIHFEYTLLSHYSQEQKEKFPHFSIRDKLYAVI